MSSSFQPGGDYDGIAFTSLDSRGQDATGAYFIGCEFSASHFADARLERARLVETRFSAITANELHLGGATLHEVQFEHARIGALSAFDADLTRVRLVGGKYDYLNLAGSRIKDVLLRGCVVGEMDLSDASVKQLTLQDTRVDRLRLTRARLEGADLRGADCAAFEGLDGLSGAILTPHQLFSLAPALAAKMGIIVREPDEGAKQRGPTCVRPEDC